jgi:hypothetical protein
LPVRERIVSGLFFCAMPAMRFTIRDLLWWTFLAAMLAFTFSWVYAG